jgi:transposase
MLEGMSELPDDVASLKRLLAAALAALKAQAREIETLKTQLTRLRRTKFGRSSERRARAIAQIECALEDRETDEAAPARKPARRPLPDHLLRQEVRHAPVTRCPECGGPVRLLGEDRTQVLDYVPGRFRVIEHVRPKLSCRVCEAIHQPPPPDLPIQRGRPGPGLLAHVVVAKFCDHTPLYRQAEQYAREGVALSRTTLAGWVGRVAWEVRPVIEAIAAYVLAADKIHGDDTPVRVLAPGAGKTRTGRFWVYVRDDRRSGSPAPPAVLCCYSADRKSAHPQRHLDGFRGVLQADGYAGFNEIYRTGAVVEASCWAHVRRKFFDVHAATGSPIARKAVERIGALYAIERAIAGCPAEERRQTRLARAGPLLAELQQWFETTLLYLSGKSELAAVIRYALKRWDALARYRDDGRIEIDNNTAERAIRGIAVGRKNWLFVGSDQGGDRAAALYTMIETCKLNGVDPEAYLCDLLGRLATHPAKRIHELLPWVWAEMHPARDSAQAA